VNGLERALPPGEQIELCRRAQAGDVAARHRLVETTLRYVAMRAQKLRVINPNVEFDELLHEGAIGLLHAIDGFDCERGVRFLTYAGRCVDQRIRWLLWCERGVSRRDASFITSVHDVRRLVDGGASLEQALADVAAEQGIAVRVLERAYRAVRRSPALSLDVSANGDGETFKDRLSVAEEDPAERIDRDADHRAVRDAARRIEKDLTPAEARILAERILADEGDRKTLDQLATDFHLSRQWVQQLEVGIKNKLGYELGRALKVPGRRRRRRKPGRCFCGNTARPGSETCARHNEKWKATRAKRAERRAAGLCWRCGRERAANRGRCDACKRSIEPKHEDEEMAA